MVDYVKSVNFYAKDALLSGNPDKIIKGAEIDTEYNSIATAVASKADLNSPTFTGSPTAPTAPANTNTTQIATTAFVRSSLSEANASANITGGTISGVAITGGTITGLSSPLLPASGGTGLNSIPAKGVVIGNGAGAVTTVAPGSSGNVLRSNGTDWVSQSLGSLGVGQTWQTVSRTNGTTYTNSTANPIFVIANINMTLSGSGSCSVVVSGVTILSFSYSSNAGGGGQPAPLSFIVPSGANYSISTSGNMSIVYTAELR